MCLLDRKDYLSLIKPALREDIGTGDVTSLSIIPEGLNCIGSLLAREEIVIAGLSVARDVFLKVDPHLRLFPQTRDGEKASAGTEILCVKGRARSILSAERTALNFLQRLCSIATLTHRYVQALADFPTQILDTRKTTPGWRRLEKYAVACGGGKNHRMGLFDRVMIKDNHLAILEKEIISNSDSYSNSSSYSNSDSDSSNSNSSIANSNSKKSSIEEAVRRARENFPSLIVEVEVDSPEQARRAAEAGADMILLDNMSPNVLRECVSMIGRRARIEASGKMTLETIRQVAETGVDYISVGALTHSATAVDLTLDISIEESKELHER